METATVRDTRERIIECSTQAMIAKGYHGVGLNEILAAASVPKGSFYHHFASKEDLGVAVIERAAQEYLETLQQFFTDESHTPLNRLKNFYGWVRSYVVETGYSQECVICKLAHELGTLSDTLRSAVKQVWDQCGDAMAGCLAEAQQAGEIPADLDANQTADFLLSAFEGVMIRVQVDRDVRAVDQFLHLIFNHLLAVR